jgi:hypothetical protein
MPLLELAVQVPVLAISPLQALDRLFGLLMGLVAASYDFFWIICNFGVHINLCPYWNLQYKLLYCLF